MTKKISIVIITYNRIENLLIAIKSVKKQINIKYEMIIVDNNSNDSTEEVINKLASENKDIKYIKLNDNKGVAIARNIGFENCNGEYVFFLDDDAYISKNDFLYNLVDIIENNSMIGAISSRVYDTQKKKDLIPTRSKLHSNKLLYFQGGSHLIRKSIFGNSSLYPEIKYGSEELFAAFRIYNKGYYIFYSEKNLVIHDPNVLNRIDKKDTYYFNLVNRYRVKLKLFPLVILPLEYLVIAIKLMKGFGLNKYYWNIFLNDNTKYSKNFKRISLKVFINLVREFGLLKII